MPHPGAFSDWRVFLSDPGLFETLRNLPLPISARFLAQAVRWESGVGPLQKRREGFERRAAAVVPETARDEWVQYMLLRMLAFIMPLWYGGSPHRADWFRHTGKAQLASAVAHHGGAVLVTTHVGPYFTAPTTLIDEQIRLVIPVDAPVVPYLRQLWQQGGVLPHQRQLAPIPGTRSADFYGFLNQGYLPLLFVDHFYDPGVQLRQWGTFVVQMAFAKRWPILPVTIQQQPDFTSDTQVGEPLWHPEDHPADELLVLRQLDQWVRQVISERPGQWWGWSATDRIPVILP